MHLLLKVIVDTEKCALLVTNTRGLGFFIAKWVWQRLTGVADAKRLMLQRLIVLCAPFDDGCQHIHVSQTGKLTLEPCSAEQLGEIEQIAIDEVTLYRMPNLNLSWQAQHCCHSATQLSQIRKFETSSTKVLVCSDFSQSEGRTVQVPDGAHTVISLHPKRACFPH